MGDQIDGSPFPETRSTCSRYPIRIETSVVSKSRQVHEYYLFCMYVLWRMTVVILTRFLVIKRSGGDLLDRHDEIQLCE
jgi:hypothetical protein